MQQGIKEELVRRKPGETFAWPVVNLINNSREFSMRDRLQAGILGKILAKQTICVFIGASLPRGIGVGKEKRYLVDGG